MKNKNILRDHIGFAIFLFLLLICPKIPIHLGGGSEKSSISLGFMGYVIWFLMCPSYLFEFHKRKNILPFFFLIFFAFYVFLISLLSENLVSIIYALQFLFYVVFGSLFLNEYLLRSEMNNSMVISFRILFSIIIIYNVGVIISIFTGPFYPHQTIFTFRPWGYMWIQQGVGFSESQNMAAELLIIFTAAFIYIYQAKKFKKVILICLSLCALILTLSRSAIVAFSIAMIILSFIELIRIIFQRKIIKKILFNIVYFSSGVFLILTISVLFLYFINKPLLIAVLSGFGLGENASFIIDLNTRLNLWVGGLDKLSTESIFSLIFGGGFRSSMGIVTETGAWFTFHNLFITILIEFGFVGFIIFISFLLIIFLKYLNVILTERDIDISLSARFGFISMLGITIHNFTGEFLYSPVSMSVLILAISLGFSGLNVFNIFNRGNKK
jgi:O-antigen ligase